MNQGDVIDDDVRQLIVRVPDNICVWDHDPLERPVWVGPTVQTYIDSDFWTGRAEREGEAYKIFVTRETLYCVYVYLFTTGNKNSDTNKDHKATQQTELRPHQD